MKFRKIPLFLWFVIAANVWWLIVVLLAYAVYFSSSMDNVEAAGFLLAFLGLPTTMLVSFFDVSVRAQMLLMVFFGFLQWNLFGFLTGFFVRKVVNRKTIGI